MSQHKEAYIILHHKALYHDMLICHNYSGIPIRGDYSGRPSAKNRPISQIATHFLVWSDTCQIREEWLYIVVLTCVVGVADKTI